MKIKSLFAGFLALATLASCSNDLLDETGKLPNGSDEAGVYMSVLVSMPNAKGSRSFTDPANGSTDGTEVGTDAENRVSTLLLVLATKDNKYIAHSFVDNNLTALNGGTNYSATGKITKTELADFYNTKPTNTDVNVFVYCNPTASLVNVFEGSTAVPADWYNKICEVNEGESVWSDNNFLMSNAAIAVRSLPANIDDWNAYTSESNPFNLSGQNNPGGANEIDNLAKGGAIKVERSVARFDFRDGSKDDTEIAALNLPANTYPVVRGTNEDGTPGDYIITVQLNKMCLVNMSNCFYYLRRVSDDGTNTDMSLCGAEKPWYTNENGLPVPGLTGNYIVDTHADVKADGNLKTGFSTYFNYPFFDDNGVVDHYENNFRWYISSISDVLNGHDDANSKYKVWRYVTENAIPANEENQVNGVSTGVVFKGKLQATEALRDSEKEEDKALAEALDGTKLGNPNTDPILYLFGGSLYCSWEQVRKYALSISYNSETNEWNRTNTLYKAVFGEGGTGEEFDTEAEDVNSPNALWKIWDNAGRPAGVALQNFKKAAVGAKMTLYQSSEDEQDGWGYYCYYYYWNRHNDNLIPGQMGPMEFAVVRNNVYKLAVTKISQLGHPRIAENDPDDPKPDTPDEKGDVYMTVECEVLPWVVRINNIEF